MQVVLADKPAPVLADYGLFQDVRANIPSERVQAYDLVNPLFTDYADKHRFVYIPKGESAVYEAVDALEFPVGTVLVKTFGYAPDMRTPEAGAYKVETRLLIHKKDGWVAAPYVWNKEQTEARYAPVGARLHVQTIAPDGEKLDFSYGVPNANQCKTCHQSGHDVLPIGPKARNLNHNNQLQTWRTQGLLSGLPANDVPIVPSALDSSFPLDVRARAYLDINCAHCHKPDGSASNSGLMLEWGETDQTRIGIGKHPTAAGRGSGGLLTVITPSNPDSSIMVYRMQSTAPGIAMPELGRTLAHKEGVELIREWIAEMPAENNH
jgi:uncharacterized repeat protein (TIGR03806 family)